MLLLPLILLALQGLLVSAEQYSVYHRFAEKNARWVRRGAVIVPSSSPSSTGWGWEEDPGAAGGSAATSESAWYQVAILVDGEYITASIPSCFASQPAGLTLHFTGQRPSSIEYKPLNDTCVPGPASLPTHPLAVTMSAARVVRGPSLAAPQVVTADGKKVEPEPEKTFFQKYWIAIVAGLLFIGSVMGPDEPAKRPEGAPQRLQ